MSSTRFCSDSRLGEVLRIIIDLAITLKGSLQFPVSSCCYKYDILHSDLNIPRFHVFSSKCVGLRKTTILPATCVTYVPILPSSSISALFADIVTALIDLLLITTKV